VEWQYGHVFISSILAHNHSHSPTATPQYYSKVYNRIVVVNCYLFY
jgi:hypothetical protein